MLTDLSPPDWRSVAQAARAQADDYSCDALYRTLNYLCAASLYLRDNILLQDELHASHVKPKPTGHWGVCPPVNLVLAALAPALRGGEVAEVELVHGAAHAGASALAFSYLTGALGRRWTQFLQSRDGLNSLVSDFPHAATVGAEVSPLIPGHSYMGGQLGPALGVSMGAVLDAPRRLAVTLIGDGECETGLTAAAWLGRRALGGGSLHGSVLPVVLLNGLRMGSQSLLAGLDLRAVGDFLSGLGYAPVFDDGRDVAKFRGVLLDAIASAAPLGDDGPHPVVVLTLPKGSTGPASVDGVPILGTPRVHKTPLADPAADPVQLEALRSWLSSYGPADLLTPEGSPTAVVQRSLPREPAQAPASVSAPPAAKARSVRRASPGLGGVLSAVVVAQRSEADTLRIFSPDELSSNQIEIPQDLMADTVVEVLNEELCHAFLQGYVQSGRRGVFVSYEAFATLNVSLIEQFLKTRALQRRAGEDVGPSLNYVLTSISWRNCYSHQAPSGLVSALVATGDQSVRIYTPADDVRAAALLSAMLESRGHVNVMVADKHSRDRWPSTARADELRSGAASWPERSDGGRPDLVLAAAGDVATAALVGLQDELRRVRPLSTRFVLISELTCLGSPLERQHALSNQEFQQLFGEDTPVILVVPGTVTVAQGLLWERGETPHRFQLRGYRDPGRPTEVDALRRHCGIDVSNLMTLVDEMVPGAATEPRSEATEGGPGAQ